MKTSRHHWLKLHESIKAKGLEKRTFFSKETRMLMVKKRQLKRPKTARKKVRFAELSKLVSKTQQADMQKHKTKTINKVVEEGKGLKAKSKEAFTRLFPFDWHTYWRPKVKAPSAETGLLNKHANSTKNYTPATSTKATGQ